MKTVFVINPRAGTGKETEKLISDAAKSAEIYITKCEGDATWFVKEYCQKNGPARFIACGGDGTLSEVLNGLADCTEAQIGVLPKGTGNDFCRNFKMAGDFADIKSQLSGGTIKCDAIKYKTVLGGKEVSGYCINMFNIGFDCNVADLTANMKKKPFISGPFAYLLSIFANLIKKKGANLKIEIDDEEFYSGRLLLASIANGSYCGGGILSNPLASIYDGLININVVYNVSRLKFLSLLPHYMKGTHINLAGIEKVIHNTKCKKVVLTPLDGEMKICIDGEIITAGRTEFEIVPSAVNFVVPKKYTESKITERKNEKQNI